MRYMNDISKLLNMAHSGTRTLVFQAKPSKEELSAINWLYQTAGGDITFLAESTVEGTKNPDLLWNGLVMDIKHTKGTINTLKSHINKAMKQTNKGGVLIDVTGTEIENSKLIETCIYKLADTKGTCLILIRNQELVAYIYKEV